MFQFMKLNSVHKSPPPPPPLLVFLWSCGGTEAFHLSRATRLPAPDPIHYPVPGTNSRATCPPLLFSIFGQRTGHFVAAPLCNMLSVDKQFFGIMATATAPTLDNASDQRVSSRLVSWSRSSRGFCNWRAFIEIKS